MSKFCDVCRYLDHNTEIHDTYAAQMLDAYYGGDVIPNYITEE